MDQDARPQLKMGWAKTNNGKPLTESQPKTVKKS